MNLEFHIGEVDMQLLNSLNLEEVQEQAKSFVIQNHRYHYYKYLEILEKYIASGDLIINFDTSLYYLIHRQKLDLAPMYNLICSSEEIENTVAKIAKEMQKLTKSYPNYRTDIINYKSTIKKNYMINVNTDGIALIYDYKNANKLLNQVKSVESYFLTGKKLFVLDVPFNLAFIYYNNISPLSGDNHYTEEEKELYNYFIKHHLVGPQISMVRGYTQTTTVNYTKAQETKIFEVLENYKYLICGEKALLLLNGSERLARIQIVLEFSESENGGSTIQNIQKSLSEKINRTVYHQKTPCGIPGLPIFYKYEFYFKSDNTEKDSHLLDIFNFNIFNITAPHDKKKKIASLFSLIFFRFVDYIIIRSKENLSDDLKNKMNTGITNNINYIRFLIDSYKNNSSALYSLNKEDYIGNCKGINSVTKNYMEKFTFPDFN